ncbi:LysR substrate-binding domain-containing protein [Paraburkholderia ultramafica]|uniref:LysR substrate-binding domain-containing protein n=1 Tax=Paraburkholderia ultramafica TaxID=1544867 RepID=UPI0015815409|nr:LysR substrate-binding domain-containing protein [Paraburkholderia ultramafica]
MSWRHNDHRTHRCRRVQQCICRGQFHSNRSRTSIRAISDHDCLVFRPKGPSWQFESPRGPIAVDVPQKLIANDNSMLFAAACAGNGIAVLPTYLAKAGVADGRLESLLLDFPLRATWLKALLPKRRQQLPQVAALAGWLRVHLENAPPWGRD